MRICTAALLPQSLWILLTNNTTSVIQCVHKEWIRSRKTKKALKTKRKNTKEVLHTHPTVSLEDAVHCIVKQLPVKNST